MDWTPALLDKVTDTLGVLYPDEWSRVAREMGARDTVVKCSYTVHTNFSVEATCGWWPTHDPESNTVIVRNPFAGRRVMIDGRDVCGSFIEIDAEVAEKILVLGVAP